MLEERHEDMLADVIRNQLRIGFQYKLSDRWTVRNRAEWTIYDKERAIQAKGWLVYQDVFWKGYQKKLDVNIRFACFDTDGYNARIYAYENNVLYASGFPLYYDKGIRTYINLRWRAFHSVDLWARYALTKYIDKESVGSGLDQISNDKKSDVTLQLRWQW